MPHYSNYGGTRFSAQPADELTGTFNALNETTNFDDRGGVTGGFSPISGNGVFRPQFIEPNHFTPDRGGDSLTGDGRPMNIWGNGGASTFEDRVFGGFDANDFHACPNKKSDQDLNDVVIGVEENIDWTAANGGPGSSYLAAKTASKVDAYVDADVDGFMKLGDIKGELQTTDLRSDNRFVIERFEPLAEMNSFGESLNPVLELGDQVGPGGTTFMTGSLGCQTMPPMDNIAIEKM